MPRGPAPKPGRRRRNTPTIATTELPAEGRKGRVPAVPTGYKLQKVGRAWWNWAWKLPQATKWDDGALYVVARRAQLEDDLITLDDAEGFDVESILGSFDEDFKGEKELKTHIEVLVHKLKSMASGRVSVMKEMRELDNRLGLNPKALIDLRWTIAEPDETAKEKSKGSRKKAKAKVAQLDDYRDRLG